MRSTATPPTTPPATTAPPPLPWNIRTWLLFYGLGASVLYAGSFTLITPMPRVIAVATAIVLAVLVTGAALFAFLSLRHPAGGLSWLDALLLALRVGLWATLLGVLVNLGIRRGLGWLYPHRIQLHLAIAALANLAMLAVFLRRAHARGLAPAAALGYWLAADAAFVAALWVLWPRV